MTTAPNRVRITDRLVPASPAGAKISVQRSNTYPPMAEDGWVTIEERSGYEAVIRVRMNSGSEKFLSQEEADRLEYSEPETFHLPWPKEETITARVFNAELVIFTLHPDRQLLVDSTKIGRYDVIFTDRRCLFFPMKSGDFWKNLDWVELGRLGGALGVFAAHATRAAVDGIKALLKDQQRFMMAELDALAKTADAEVVGYENILSVEGHKEKRSLMQMAYFDSADISVHISAARRDDYPRNYALTLSGGEKGIRSFLSKTGISQPLQMRNPS